MKYKIKHIRKLIAHCDTMADKWRIVRDENPTRQVHDAIIYFLSKRLKYLYEIDKHKRKINCCALLH